LYAKRESVQRTGGCAEMPLREMQIDRGLFQVAMAEQHLDGSQVGSRFEQVGGKTMTQGVWMDVLVLKTCAFGRMQAGPPEDLGVDRTVRSVEAPAGKEPVRRLTLKLTPVTAQRIQQRRAEHDIAALRPLPPRMWMTMRWLSISLIFKCATSARRPPVA
jgi:hypothetical protein